MEIRAGHRAPRPTPEDQTSCSGGRKNPQKNKKQKQKQARRTRNTFKSDDKCSLLENNKYWHG